MQLADLDAVTLDAYGTLVELVDPVPLLQDGLKALGVERDAPAVARAFAREVAYYRERSFEGRDRESLFRLRRECVAIILGDLGSDLRPESFVDGFVAAMRMRLIPGAAAALNALQRRGLAVAVVSNWDVGLPEQLHGLGLGDVPVVTSAEVGVPKPDPAVFLHALELLRVRPGRALHVGDSNADEAGARAAGMHFASAPLSAAVGTLS